MGPDPGYAFGIIIYGAGFIPESEGNLTAKGQPKDFKSKLLKTWDPSIWLPKVVAPTFWVNGTNDPFFPLNTWQRSVDASGGSTRQLIIPNMAHGHNVAWELAELDAFAKGAVSDKPFPSLSRPSCEGHMASCSVSEGTRPVSGNLTFTRDSGTPVSRKWGSAPATVQGNTLTADVPDGAWQIFFSLTTEDGVRCSSPLLDLP
jgi:PhoPQ-activated pathogenicity-related protein